MKRIHLFEFEDFEWFPSLIRNFGTDYLRFIVNKMNAYKPIVPILKNLRDKTNQNRIIDIASGGGGAWESLSKEFQSSRLDFKITLSDYFPNFEIFEKLKSEKNCIDSYIREKTDARNIPSNQKGIRTMFLSFHHFKPNDAKLILKNAIDAEQPIAIFELQERSFMSIFVIFFSPINVLLLTPFFGKISFNRILFTYLIPIVPLFVWWDGIVSCLRTYSIPEMNHMINEIDPEKSYIWNIGKVENGIAPVLYLTGIKSNN